MAGIPFQHLPYRGRSQAAIEVIGKHIDFVSDTPTLLLEQIGGGKLRGLGNAPFPTAPAAFRERAAAYDSPSNGQRENLNTIGARWPTAPAVAADPEPRQHPQV